MSSTRSVNTDPRPVAVLGHSAEGTGRVDGQIQRTKIVVEEFRNRLGPENLRFADTGHLSTRPLRTVMRCWQAVSGCSDIVIMPGVRGLRWLLPLYLYWRRRYGFRVHYLVVGGWLPRYLSEEPLVCFRLQECASIHVQTRRMLAELRQLGLNNVHLLPNFRNFAEGAATSTEIGRPFRLVYMSRLLPEKGPELAIEAVQAINRECGYVRMKLDLWGPIQKGQTDWFKSLMSYAGPEIVYRAVLDPEKIPGTLARYDAMVFPTYYAGEGFPGAILDAFVSGIPVIASDWQDNSEVIEAGVTGVLFKAKDIHDLKTKLLWALDHPDEMIRMKANATAAARQFHVDQVIPPLLETMGLADRTVRDTEFHPAVS